MPKKNDHGTWALLLSSFVLWFSFCIWDDTRNLMAGTKPRDIAILHISAWAFWGLVSLIGVCIATRDFIRSRRKHDPR